ncbi:hypothetical protein RKE29_02175 [Streptomyces sp. B1866]|uniref:hypothetical protein n=1 Tax=Streptomyces sp. B1866 TaxID=3075431 RepID=UPI002891E456|nr:hypothetical protein [Streptomyces sp. B1866]MDT3395468.1 hypothetical protein [Streptomyces sp. B1866]
MSSTPDPTFPYPQVGVTITVALTSGRYATQRDVLDHLTEQTRHLPPGCEVDVQLGRTALRVAGSGLPHAIAAACYLGVSRVTLSVRGGAPGLAWLQAYVLRYVRLLREDHARMLAERPTGTG